MFGSRKEALSKAFFFFFFAGGRGECISVSQSMTCEKKGLDLESPLPPACPNSEAILKQNNHPNWASLPEETNFIT